MRFALLGLALVFSSISTAHADPVLKIINFTADWCPNCQILNPRMDDAISRFDAGEIERVDLDMTEARRGKSQQVRLDTHADAMRLADRHQAGYLWDWYGGVTGIAVVVAADNGEPITCFMRTLSVDQIADRLKLSKILAESAKPGARKPQGPDCPPPLR